MDLIFHTLSSALWTPATLVVTLLKYDNLLCHMGSLYLLLPLPGRLCSQLFMWLVP